MRPHFISCSRCNSQLQQSMVELDASGHGYSLRITGVPVFSCEHCGYNLIINENIAGVNDIVAAAMSALDNLGPISLGTPRATPSHCRSCRAQLPSEIDSVPGTFISNHRIGSTSYTIGVSFRGESLTCQSCGKKHPHLPSVLYHEVSRSITRAASHYAFQ